MPDRVICQTYAYPTNENPSFVDSLPQVPNPARLLLLKASKCANIGSEPSHGMCVRISFIFLWLCNHLHDGRQSSSRVSRKDPSDHMACALQSWQRNMVKRVNWDYYCHMTYVFPKQCNTTTVIAVNRPNHEFCKNHTKEFTQPNDCSIMLF